MKHILFAALALLLLTGGPALPARAALNEAGFLVTPLLPPNQEDRQASNFDLLTAPGDTQRLEILVENTGPEPITVAVEVIAASTDRNGRIHYSSPGLTDESMAHPLPSLAVPETPVLEIPARESKTAALLLTLPEEPLTGTVLGAVRLIRQPGGEEDTGGAGIINQYSYALGVRLRDAESLAEAQAPEPRFLLGEVYADSVNHKAAIVAGIRNTEPAIARGLAFRAQVFQAENAAVPIIEKTQEDVEMAPNSIFPLTMTDREGYGFPAGDYVAVIRLDCNGETLEMRREFTVLPQAAEEINGDAVNQSQNQTAPVAPEENQPSPIVAAGVGAAVLAVLLLMAGWRRRAVKGL